MANDIPDIKHLTRVQRKLADIANSLEKVSKYENAWTQEASKGSKVIGDLVNTLEGYNDTLDHLLATPVEDRNAQWAVSFEKLKKKIAENNKELDKATGKYKTWKIVVKGAVLEAEKAFSAFGKQLVATTTALSELGVEKIASGIKRVYEYQERWTKALGQMNLRIGALSPNMGGFVKMAKSWEGTVRGLTDQFGAGLQMAQEFTEGFGRILDDKTEQRWGKLGLQVSRGLGLGGAAAGELLRTFYQLGETPEQSQEAFRSVIVGAKAANVPVNKFAQEIAQSRDFMISFGKEGQKSFLNAAAYAKKLGVSLKSLEEFTKLTDTFDSTAEMAAKLNTVFGSSINALDLMLEQDPGKRLETVRKELLAQGRTFDSLNRQERDLLADTIHVSKEELAGVLKSGMSLEQFQRDKEREDAKAAKTQKLLQQALASTAETMFAFGAAADRITGHIKKLIFPFLKMLGLARDGGKDFKTFGQVMSTLEHHLEKFIDDVAGDQGFQRFMQEMADDVLMAAKAVGKFIQQGKIGDVLKTIVPAAKSFYEFVRSGFETMLSVGEKMMPVFKFIADHLTGIISAWGILQGGKFIGSIASGAAGTAKSLAKIASAGTGGDDGQLSLPGIGGGSAGGGGVRAAFNRAAGPTLGGSVGATPVAVTAMSAIAAGAIGLAVGTWIDEKTGLSDKISELAYNLDPAKLIDDMKYATGVTLNQAQLKAEAVKKGDSVSKLQAGGLTRGQAIAAQGFSKNYRGDSVGLAIATKGLSKTISDSAIEEQKTNLKKKKLNEQEIQAAEDIAQARIHLLRETILENDLSKRVTELQSKDKTLTADRAKELALQEIANEGGTFSSVASEELKYRYSTSAARTASRKPLGLSSDATDSGPGRGNSGSRSGGKTRVEISVADVHIDGAKVGRAIVKHAVREET